MEEQKKKNPIALISIIVLVLVVAYFGYMKYMKKDTAVVETNTQNEVLEIVPAYIYKDGIYPATGDYYSPGGPEQIKVSLVVKNDVVTDATVESLATLPVSKTMQGQFIAGYKEFVIGKKLDEISVTKVSGSSLTPKGFMEALSEIKEAAKV